MDLDVRGLDDRGGHHHRLRGSGGRHDHRGGAHHMGVGRDHHLADYGHGQALGRI